jgi:nicotinamidase-related amidase
LKLALLIIDMQKLFIDPGRSRMDVERACEHINHVAGLLRRGGHTVVHVRDVEEAEAGEERLGFIPEVRVEPSDLHVEKVYSNAFWQTGLEALLREAGADLVIVSGYAAQHCVLATYNGAAERGFKPVMLQRGILSEYEDAIAASYRDRNFISYPVVETMVSAR